MGMTTLVLLSNRPRTMMVQVLLMVNTLSTFPTAESNTSSITPTTMTVMSLMLPTRENHTMLLLPPLPTTLSMPQLLLTLCTLQLLLPMLSTLQLLLLTPSMLHSPTTDLPMDLPRSRHWSNLTKEVNIYCNNPNIY